MPGACTVSIGLDLQEEDFADTGYQVTPTDAGPNSAVPPNVQQLGPLTVEDFYRKPEASKDESRRVLI